MNQKTKLLVRLLLLVVAFQALTKAAAAQSTPLSLKAAIGLALNNNHSLKADSLGITETVYRNKELAGGFLPQVNYSSSVESNLAIPSQMLPGSMVGQPSKELVPVRFGTRYGIKSGIEVSQTIFRKDLSVKMQAADLYTGIAKTKYNLSREELVNLVATSFFALQSGLERVQSTLHDYNNINEILIVARAQFEQGTLKRIDYQTLQINLANKQSQLDQYKTRYSEQQVYFNYLLGLPANTEIVTGDDYSRASGLETPNNGVPNRNDIKLYHQMIESKWVDVKSIRAERLPVVTSYFRFSVQSQFNKAADAFNGDFRYKASSVGITTSVSLFDGNRRKNRLNATQIQLDQLQLESRQLEDKAQMERVKALETFRNNKQQLSITKENLALAERVFSSRKALYTEGVTTLIELLDAEKELSQARTNYTQAMIDVQKGWLEVHKANGTLFTDYIQSL